MSDPLLPREVRRRLAIIQHAEEVTGNVAMTCRYYGISRTVYYRWLRRYREQGVDGLRDLSRRPRHSPNATHVDVVGKILYLHQNYHFGPGKIAMYLKHRSIFSRPTSSGLSTTRPPNTGTPSTRYACTSHLACCRLTRSSTETPDGFAWCAPSGFTPRSWASGPW
jgi:hypothetical protein